MEVIELHLRAQVLLEIHKNENSYNLRRMNDFFQIRYKSNLGRNSLRYREPIVWNSIPISTDFYYVADQVRFSLWNLRFDQDFSPIDWKSFGECSISGAKQLP